MSLIFITGMSGTGKSAVKEELTRRGYLAYDTDENGLTVWINRQTGLPFEDEPIIQYGTPEWYETYLWTLQTDKVREKAAQAAGKPVFMCGIPGNWRDVIPMFDKVFCLTLDSETLEHRLLHRTNNIYGKAPHELKIILERNESRGAEAEKLGATTIDAGRPVSEVADTMLKSLE